MSLSKTFCLIFYDSESADLLNVKKSVDSVKKATVWHKYLEGVLFLKFPGHFLLLCEAGALYHGRLEAFWDDFMRNENSYTLDHKGPEVRLCM